MGGWRCLTGLCARRRASADRAGADVLAPAVKTPAWASPGHGEQVPQSDPSHAPSVSSTQRSSSLHYLTGDSFIVRTNAVDM